MTACIISDTHYHIIIIIIIFVNLKLMLNIYMIQKYMLLHISNNGNCEEVITDHHNIIFFFCGLAFNNVQVVSNIFSIPKHE